MSRRSPRVRARFAATVQIGGVEHTLICHTRDISAEGCFLETSEAVAPGVQLALSVMDNERGEVVHVEGRVSRVSDGEDRGIGISLVKPLDDWQRMVESFQRAQEEDRQRPNIRLQILVVSSEENRRGALALYVTSGWDIRFATDAASAMEAMGGSNLDAIICEDSSDGVTWPTVLKVAQARQSGAKRLVRCRTEGVELPIAGPEELVHRFIDSESGMDAVLDALSAELGSLRDAMRDPVTFALTLSRSASSSLLGKVLGSLSEEDDAIAVFDLDSTLLANGSRQSAILREYGKEQGLPELEKSKASDWESWDVGEAMEKTGLKASLVEEHREPFKAFWRDRFFTSEYCTLDEMIDGAAAFVQGVLSTDSKVYYVTGRHEAMRDGTCECLARHGFPVPNGSSVQLLMKPTLAEDDDEYKLETYSRLAKEGTVVAAFDNEPTHINGYCKAFPKAYSIHLATDHSGRDVKVDPEVISIADFSRL